MNEKHNNEHENERRSRAPGRADPSTPRRRQRLPVLAILRIDDSIAANEHHPLAASSPDIREASRLRLIASILARMAGAAVKRGG
jgi:hypothetical protein